MIANSTATLNRLENHPDLFVPHMRRINRTRRRIKFSLALVFVALILLLAWAHFSQYDRTAVCLGEFKACYLPGENSSANLPRFIRANMDSQIALMTVAEGSEFKQGDWLYELAAADLGREIAQAEKYVKLLKRNYDLDLYKAHVDSNNERELMLAITQLEKLRQRYKDRFAIAPYDGVVMKVHRTQGEWAAAGSSILEIAPRSDLIFTALVHSQDSAKISVDCRAHIFPETFEFPQDRPLPGRVINMAPSAEYLKKSDLQYHVLLVNIRLENQVDVDRIRHGMIGQCVIFSDAKTSRLNALLNRFYPRRHRKFSRASNARNASY